MTKAKPRILFFVPVPNPEKGITGAVLGSQTVLEAARAAFRTQIVAMRHSAIRDSDAGLSPRALWRLFADHRASLKDLRAAMLDEPDRPLTLYMVANSSLMASLRDWWSILVASRARPDARLVLHTRNGNFFYPKGALAHSVRRRMLKRADRIICLSKRLLPPAGDLEALLPGLEAKLRVVPNTIDRALIPDASQLAASHARTGPIRVLYLSNFIPSKGYQILGEAVRLLAERGLAERFRFVFRGKWMNDEQRAAFIASLNPALIESGMVDIGGSLWERREVQAELLASDAFCLPTSYPAEAMPRSILEAMACRCAVIANDHASIADLIEDGRSGLLRKAIRAQDIADFLEAHDRQALSAMGDASLARFADGFTPETHDLNVVEALR
ncbi:MAG: glycosyltransferase family 4 protein [Pseudomonadota bacterium]